jgi:hypothetical protein
LEVGAGGVDEGEAGFEGGVETGLMEVVVSGKMDFHGGEEGGTYGTDENV